MNRRRIALNLVVKVLRSPMGRRAVIQAVQNRRARQLIFRLIRSRLRR